MARKIALTPASIDALQKGTLVDLLTPGLAIEVLGSGKKRWRYRRLVAGSTVIATLFGQTFPAQTIAAAREWARGLSATCVVTSNGPFRCRACLSPAVASARQPDWQ